MPAPGAADPNAPCPAAELAQRLGVAEAAIADWLASGCPATVDGLLDPFAVTAWLQDGRLDRCPLLRRRWDAYVRWFAPVLEGVDRPRRLRVRRRHRLLLECPAPARWWLPGLERAGIGQACADETWQSDATAQSRSAGGGLADLRWDAPAQPQSEAVATVDLTPLDPGTDVDLAAALREVAGGFRYAYRRHRPGELLRPDPQRSEGSCLDCCLALGGRLDALGRRWRLRAGVACSAAIANPHFWIEAELAGGRWCILDPSLPAIVRMLGGDWQRWAAACAGPRDARRVALESPPAVPVAGGMTIGGLIGEAEVVVAGKPENAWACIDWVCGVCVWDFAPA